MAESAILVHCPMSPFFKIGEREREFGERDNGDKAGESPGDRRTWPSLAKFLHSNKNPAYRREFCKNELPLSSKQNISENIFEKYYV